MQRSNALNLKYFKIAAIAAVATIAIIVIVALVFFIEFPPTPPTLTPTVQIDPSSVHVSSKTTFTYTMPAYWPIPSVTPSPAPAQNPSKKFGIIYLVDRSPSIDYCDPKQKNVRYKLPRFLTTVLNRYPGIDQNMIKVGFGLFPEISNPNQASEWWRSPSPEIPGRLSMVSTDAFVEQVFELSIDKKDGMGIVDAIEVAIDTAKNNQFETVSIIIITDGMFGDFNVATYPDYETILPKLKEISQDPKSDMGISLNVLFLSCPELLSQKRVSLEVQSKSMEKWASLNGLDLKGSKLSVHMIRPDFGVEFLIEDYFEQLIREDPFIKDLLPIEKYPERRHLSELNPDQSWSVRGGIHELTISGVAVEPGQGVTLTVDSKPVDDEANQHLAFEFSPKLYIKAGCPDTNWILSTEDDGYAVFWFDYTEPEFEISIATINDGNSIINNGPFNIRYSLRENKLNLSEEQNKLEFGECYDLRVLTDYFKNEIALKEAFGEQQTIEVSSHLEMDHKKNKFDVHLQLINGQENHELTFAEQHGEARTIIVPEADHMLVTADSIEIPLAYYNTHFFPSLPEPKVYFLSSYDSKDPGSFPLECKDADPESITGSQIYGSALMLNFGDFKNNGLRITPYWQEGTEIIKIHYPDYWLGAEGEGSCYTAVLLQWENPEWPSLICRIDDKQCSMDNQIRVSPR